MTAEESYTYMRWIISLVSRLDKKKKKIPILAGKNSISKLDFVINTR